MHHSIIANQQAEAATSSELEAAKERERALVAQLKELGVQPKVTAPAQAAAPTVIRHNMVPGVGGPSVGAMHHTIAGPGTLSHGTTPTSAPVAQYDAVTRVRDEVPGDTIIANRYAPTGQYDQNGRPIEAIVGQIEIPKAQLGLRAGDEIVHVARVAVHAAPTQAAIEHQQMLIAQGKLRAPGAALPARKVPLLSEPIEREEVAIQPVSHAEPEIDESATRFAMIELGEGKR